MRSMTGFGQAADENARYRIRVVLRSVNHRFLDLVVRLRDGQRTSEPAVRELFSSRLSRGRVEVNVDVEPLGAPPIRVDLDSRAVEELSRALDGLLEDEVIERGLTAGDLIRHPQLLRVTEPESRWGATDEELLLDVAGRALDELVEARETEGEKLAAALAERLEGLAGAGSSLQAVAAGAVEESASALRERLAALLGDREIDADRLAQEVALLADRSDVTEELDRLAAHLEHFREVTASDGAVGKRLDFLTQEIFRELNTLGSKCRNAAMTRLVLDAKVLCEQLREQVQNVE